MQTYQPLLLRNDAQFAAQEHQAAIFDNKFFICANVTISFYDLQTLQWKMVPDSKVVGHANTKNWLLHRGVVLGNKWYLFAGKKNIKLQFIKANLMAITPVPCTFTILQVTRGNKLQASH